MVATKVKKKPPKRTLPASLVTLPSEGGIVNLSGDYSYLGAGYYLSQELEGQGQPVRPICREAVDAYVVPLFLEKARLAGIPAPNYYITSDYFYPPALVDTMNPFMERHSIVRTESSQERVAKSLTRNYTYPLCVQELPKGARIGYFNAIMGWSLSARYRDLAMGIWSNFGLPLARVRVLSLPDSSVLVSAAGPLQLSMLTDKEYSHLLQAVEWPT